MTCACIKSETDQQRSQKNCPGPAKASFGEDVEPRKRITDLCTIHPLRSKLVSMLLYRLNMIPSSTYSQLLLICIIRLISSLFRLLNALQRSAALQKNGDSPFLYTLAASLSFQAIFSADSMSLALRWTMIVLVGGEQLSGEGRLQSSEMLTRP